ncbi:alkylated DNA repair protein alkB-like 8 isoform X1, partial [Sigmodon hispidus]
KQKRTKKMDDEHAQAQAISICDLHSFLFYIHTVMLMKLYIVLSSRCKNSVSFLNKGMHLQTPLVEKCQQKLWTLEADVGALWEPRWLMGNVVRLSGAPLAHGKCSSIAGNMATPRITPRKIDIVQASEQFKGGIITSDIGDLTLSKRGIRTSFTFRKVRRLPCNCNYSSVCDRQRKATPPSLPESSKEACQLEQEHVHHVYDLIASHFSSTRHSPWPRIVEFLKALPSGSIVADIGCGNGKYLGINKELYMIGCDRSQNLVDICRERQFQTLVCDALSVPFRSGAFDACISIAVIHHFSTVRTRVRFPAPTWQLTTVCSSSSRQTP